MLAAVSCHWALPWGGQSTCTIASHSRMLARNLLPRPSPLLAPLTRPAMSTYSTAVGMVFLDLLIWLSTCKPARQRADLPSHRLAE